MPFQRRITPTEKLYLAGDAITHSFSLHFVVEMSDAIELKIISDAVATTRHLHPGAHLRFKQGFIHSYWIARDEPIPVILKTMDWDGCDLQILYSQRQAFHPANATTDITYIKGLRHFLVFRAFHGVMDAMGLYHWVSDIFRALRNEPVQGADSTLTDFEFLKQKKKKEYRPNFAFDCQSPTGVTGTAHSTYRWYKVDLPGKVHALTARLCHALAESSAHRGATKARFMIPVDLRHHLPEKNTSANFANPIWLEATTTSSWQSLYIDIVQQLSNQNELKVGQYDHYLQYLPLIGIKYLFKALNYSSKKMITGLVSKLTVNLVDLQFAANQAINAYFLPIDVPACPITLIATETTDHTTLCFSISDAYATHEDCLSLADRFRNLLPSNHQLMMQKTQTVFPQDKTIFALIWEQMARHVDKPVFIKQQQSIQYSALQERVELIASYLYSLGVRSEHLIALVLPANEEAIAVMLACWYLGAAYIPIDIRTPENRILKILADAQPFLLIGEPECHGSYAGLSIAIPNELSLKELPAPATSLNQLAYVIYTSGSTGVPKGVMIEHRQLANYLAWAAATYQSNEPYHTALFTSLGFDLTITSLYLPLMTGGSISIVTDPSNPLNLVQLLTNSTINFLKLTPSHLRMIAELPFHRIQPFTVVIGGEALPVALVESFLNKLPAGILFNEYGPTETTVGCMVHRYDPIQDREGVVPIGVPAANTRIYCLNKELKPVGIAETGELYIAGNQVSRGYLHNPQTTQNSFISDPFFPDQIMYKSGDLAKYNANGLLMYLGRSDQQVKIHGHRIELCDLEAALLDLAEITQAIVSPMNDQGEPELVAYLIASQVINEAMLRERLSQSLPYYMLPKYFIFLKELPLTINGKIDKSRLPIPARTIDSYDMPKADLYQKIQYLFAHALSLPLTAVAHDTTFERLGGNSLQMAQIITQIITTILDPKFHAEFSKELSSLLLNATPHHFYQKLVQFVKE